MSQMLHYLPVWVCVCVCVCVCVWGWICTHAWLLLLQRPHTDVAPIPMDFLPINKGTGQAYGYVLYQTKITPGSHKIDIVGLRDNGVVRDNYTKDTCIYMYGHTYKHMWMYSSTRDTVHALRTTSHICSVCELYHIITGSFSGRKFLRIAWSKISWIRFSWIVETQLKTGNAPQFLQRNFSRKASNSIKFPKIFSNKNFSQYSIIECYHGNNMLFASLHIYHANHSNAYTCVAKELNQENWK